jgi:hypothetical protein
MGIRTTPVKNIRCKNRYKLFHEKELRSISLPIKLKYDTRKPGTDFPFADKKL